MRVSGRSKEVGSIVALGEPEKPSWGRKTPLILALTQNLYQQTTHHLGGANTHRNMPILNAHSRRRAVPPLADRFRIKARVPVAVGLTAFRMLLTPLTYSSLRRPAAFRPPFIYNLTQLFF